jgi:hypothetical protein
MLVYECLTLVVESSHSFACRVPSSPSLCLCSPGAGGFSIGMPHSSHDIGGSCATLRDT